MNAAKRNGLTHATPSGTPRKQEVRPKRKRPEGVRSLWDGADEANRTPDLLITNQLLYQLSYISEADYSIKK